MAKRIVKPRKAIKRTKRRSSPPVVAKVRVARARKRTNGKRVSVKPEAVVLEAMPAVAPVVALPVPRPWVELPAEPAELPVTTADALLQSVRHSVIRQLDEAGKRTRRRAIRSVMRLVAGRPWPYRPGRALVQFKSASATRIERGYAVTSSDGAREARVRIPLTIGEVRGVRGITPAGRRLDIPIERFNAGAQQPPTVEACDLAALEVEMTSAVTLDGRQQLPGLLWSMPASFSRRACKVEVAIDKPTQLKYALDPQGRLWVPPQQVPARTDIQTTAATISIAFHPPLRAGDLSHIGTLLPNVTLAHVEPELQPAGVSAGTFVQPLHRNGDDPEIEQPFDGWDARAGETGAAWRRRVGATFRHRQAIVTPQDYADIIRTIRPDVRVLDIAPARIPRGGVWRDGVRVCIATPLAGDGNLRDFLDCSEAASAAVQRRLRGRSVMGVEVIVGAPCIAVAASPPPDDPLWPYREYLVSGAAATAAESVNRQHCRAGVHFPVFSPQELQTA